MVFLNKKFKHKLKIIIIINWRLICFEAQLLYFFDFHENLNIGCNPIVLDFYENLNVGCNSIELINTAFQRLQEQHLLYFSSR